MGSERLRKRTPPSYEPSPEDIRDGCSRIRAGWTLSQRKRRMGLRHTDPVTPRVALDVVRISWGGGQFVADIVERI